MSKYLIEHCDKVTALLQEFLAKKSARLAVLQDPSRPYQRGDHHELPALQSEIYLIENGCSQRDGTSMEHWELLQRPEFRALNLLRPGLATIKAYRDRLQKQLDDETARERARTA